MYYNYNDDNDKNENQEGGFPEKESMDASPVNDVEPLQNAPEDSAPYTEPDMPSSNTVEKSYYESWKDPECSEPDNIDKAYSPNYHSSSAYGYSAVPPEKPHKEKKPMKNGTKFAIRAICLVLACGIVSGASAAYVTGRVMENSGSTTPNQVVLGSTGNSGSTDNQAASVTSPTGDVMTGGEIYKLGCEQAVGIQMNATGTSTFGQTGTTQSIVGSGFVISSDGYIVTNYHVIENVVLYGSNYGYSLSVVMNDGTTYDAEIIGYEEENDVAVLKIDATGLNAVTIGDMSSTEVGDTVYAIGNPLGTLTYSMTSGIISAMDRVISTEVTSSVNVFQIDAAINSGNSGGPVYNSKGEVIGIVDAKYNATGIEGLGFAIPIDDAMNIIQDIVQYGYVTGKAYMGVYVRTVSSTVAAYYNLAEGAYVDSLDENGCAAKAGIQAGDIITAIGNDKIASSDDLKSAKSAYSAGDTTTIEVFRSGETLTFDITFDEEPANNTTDSGSQSTQQTIPGQNGQSSGAITG